MLIQLMSDENIPDDDPAKGCTIVANVVEVKFSRLGTGEACLHVEYSQPNRGLTAEDFVLRGNAYLMNDSGKTVRSFTPTPYVKVESKQKG